MRPWTLAIKPRCSMAPSPQSSNRLYRAYVKTRAELSMGSSMAWPCQSMYPVSMLCVYVVHLPLSITDVLSRQWRNYCMCLYSVTACKNYCGSRDIMIVAGHSCLAAQDETMVPMASSRYCGCICVCYWHIPVLSVTPWT